jgi:hypothetical protein
MTPTSVSTFCFDIRAPNSRRASSPGTNPAWEWKFRRVRRGKAVKNAD